MDGIDQKRPRDGHKVSSVLDALLEDDANDDVVRKHRHHKKKKTKGAKTRKSERDTNTSKDDALEPAQKRPRISFADDGIVSLRDLAEKVICRHTQNDVDDDDYATEDVNPILYDDRDEEQQHISLTVDQSVTQDDEYDDQTQATGTDTTTAKPTEEGCDGEKLVNVVPLIYDKIEAQLGLRRDEDEYCYICDTLKMTSAQISTIAVPAISQLLEKIPDIVYENQDKVTAAIAIHDMFEETIRKPANKTCTEVCEWTLRGIYTHLTEHANTVDSILDEAVFMCRHLLRRVYRSKVYAVPKSKMHGPLTEDDVVPTKDGVAMFNNVMQRTFIAIDKREKYHMTTSGHIVGAHPALDRMPPGSSSAGRSVGSIGGRKDGAVNMSKILGSDATSYRSERASWNERNSRRIFS